MPSSARCRLIFNEKRDDVGIVLYYFYIIIRKAPQKRATGGLKQGQ